MPVGTIQRWETERGFGFISDDSDAMKKWAFVHITETPDHRAPEVGDAFSYEVREGRDGRERATRLTAL